MIPVLVHERGRDAGRHARTDCSHVDLFPAQFPDRRTEQGREIVVRGAGKLWVGHERFPVLTLPPPLGEIAAGKRDRQPARIPIHVAVHAELITAPVAAQQCEKKNDRIDAGKLADCLRCDFLPECYMASSEIRERRRTLRYRNLLVRQTVQCKNKIAQMLMEAGVSYTKEKLHHRGYFHQLLANNQEIDESLRSLLRLSRKHRAIAQDGSCTGEIAQTRSVVNGTSETAHEHSCCRPDYGIDLGVGARRRETVSFHQTSH